jgi:hypothetical protein
MRLQSHDETDVGESFYVYRWYLNYRFSIEAVLKERLDLRQLS